MIWAIQLSLGNPTARSRGRLRGGVGCPACADHVNMRSPSHGRNPKLCRWSDKEDCHWECPSCKNNYGRNKPGP
eukprot:6501219-Pyramimonas_sp.AAC.1